MSMADYLSNQYGMFLSNCTLVLKNNTAAISVVQRVKK